MSVEFHSEPLFGNGKSDGDRGPQFAVIAVTFFITRPIRAQQQTHRKPACLADLEENPASGGQTGQRSGLWRLRFPLRNFGIRFRDGTEPYGEYGRYGNRRIAIPEAEISADGCGW